MNYRRSRNSRFRNYETPDFWLRKTEVPEWAWIRILWTKVRWTYTNNSRERNETRIWNPDFTSWTPFQIEFFHPMHICQSSQYEPQFISLIPYSSSRKTSEVNKFLCPIVKLSLLLFVFLQLLTFYCLLALGFDKMSANHPVNAVQALNFFTTVGKQDCRPMCY